MASGISRRELLALAPLSAGAAMTASGDDGAMMWNYFIGELDAADERRRKAFAAIRTRAELSALQEKVKRVMRAGVGAFPARTPLNVRRTGEIRKPDYVIEKLVFESRPGFYVSANLYRPVSTASRRPTVLHLCGHGREGKTTEDYQRANIGLAKKGFVVLTFDPLGQGERLMYRNTGLKVTSEHSAAGAPTMLVGRTLTNFFMWDAMRALDYLETRPDVDSTRFGMLGHSGGGMQALLTSPLEPRIRAVMSCCAVTSFYHKTKAQLGADPEQLVPAVYPNQIDHPELIATVAPRAFLIGAVLKDFVPLDGTRRTYEEVRHVYEMLGAPENVAKVESDNTHLLDKNLREGCYGWMLKHLTGEAGDPREPDMQVESEENLWCTKTGSVMDLENAKSVFDLNRSYAAQLKGERARGKASPGQAAQSLLFLPAAAESKRKGDRIQSEPGIEVVTTLTPGSKGNGALLIVAAEQGRNSAGARELRAAFGNAGYATLGVDLRGWGETAPKSPPRKSHFNWEEFFAWRGVEMGRPLLGMRVLDLIAAVRHAKADYGKIFVVGCEGAGLVALHAAVDKSIAGVAVDRALDSYEGVMEHPLSKEPFASLVWGALTRYDLPELARSIRPRPCVAIDARDSLRQPTGPPELAVAEAAQAILKGFGLS